MKVKSQKPIFIYIYGPIAAGKLTIAKELAKITNYKNFHNHTIIDLSLELFGKDDKTRSVFRENLYFHMVESLVKLNTSTILTHAFADNFTFKTGMTDPEYVKKTEMIVEKNGGLFYGVQLVCDDKELLRRLKGESRKKHKKLKDTKVMKDLLEKYDHVTPAPIKNNFVNYNTKISAKKVADLIVKHYKLK
jgi:deoxyadenosine/deoxycytidine kinase